MTILLIFKTCFSAYVALKTGLLSRLIPSMFSCFLFVCFLSLVRNFSLQCIPPSVHAICCLKETRCHCCLYRTNGCCNVERTATVLSITNLPWFSTLFLPGGWSSAADIPSAPRNLMSRLVREWNPYPHSHPHFCCWNSIHLWKKS